MSNPAPDSIGPEQHSDGVSPYQVARVEGATVDLGRQARCGFGEVVYGEGKSAQLISRIAQAQLKNGQSVLVTRVDPSVAEEIDAAFANTKYHSLARTLRVAASPIDDTTDFSESDLHVAVVTAGSTDMNVALEAVETLRWMNVPVRLFEDIGVAGPQRLAAAAPQLCKASALVVVAGMEGALPSVVGGYVSAPIFAVPTSVGYGANLGGVTALLGMLTSCAAGVAVVNIDAGFKGGYMAGMVVRQLINASAAQTSP
ncbi:AIR carboxylase [Rubripirellula amarantea]|uniref:AIR carboxylase n=1 Tax=Rubripirellula amarantea TaxID=2527999 RepID=A0A5C5WQP3_9BACT|nr:nickel pincer cofactor biosynthesis protein LarB [Rubripirellula amarantea]TWT53116.1 AIR carboxylase [Rubripirellula amarantea]